MAVKQQTENTIARLIDELGEVEYQLEPHRSLIAREDKLRAEIRALYDEAPAWESFEVDGAKYKGLIGTRAMQKLVDNKKAFKALGQSVFIRIAKLTLAAIERETSHPAATLNAALNPKTFITEAQSGTRSLRIFRRA